MLARLESIVEHINHLKNVRITSPFEQKEEVIRGNIALTEAETILNFEVIILPEYPFQSHESETIRFINKDMLDLNHVNADGSICIHTSHCPELNQKLDLDFNGLRSWIKKYYLNKETDANYEHLIVNESLINGVRNVFLFTDVDCNFSKGEFGTFQYTILPKGKSCNIDINTYLVQSFKKDLVKCKWSGFYKTLNSNNYGFFIYIERPPAENRRFAIKTWVELEPYVSQDFLYYLNNTKKNLESKKEQIPVPLFIGYKIPTGEIHWQCAIFLSNNFPNYGEKNPVSKKFEGRLSSDGIIWAQTKNCSYKYFFGRGALHERLTNSKILIIGIGAIGSIVATTLVRGGCTNINIIDYDIKEPENVCRSEYSFITGINDKTYDLSQHLLTISPFVEIRSNERLTDYIKVSLNKEGFPEAIDEHLDQFDLIFDCTTDNDIAFILDKAKINSFVINISITNLAKELVCAVKPELYHWLKVIFQKLENDTENLYNPTGCWSPTFKASYNDIAVLVQFAIKHINKCFEKGISIRNFYISQNEDGDNLKISQY